MCRHRMWTMPTVVFTPSDSRAVKIEGGTEQLARELKYGISTVRQECIKCHYSRAYTVAGDAR